MRSKRWLTSILSLALVVLAAVAGCAAVLPGSAAPDDFARWSARLDRAVATGRAGDVPDYGLLDDASEDGVPRAIEGLARLSLARHAASPSERSDLDAAIDAKLTLCVRRVAQIYEDRSHDVEATTLGGPWSRAEASLSAWLRARAPALVRGTDGEGLARVLFRVSGGPHSLPYARRWPGFDVFRLGAGIAEEWARGGHVTTGVARVVVCPVAPSAPGYVPVAYEPGKCGWSQQALEDPRSIQRLADTLVSLGDPDLTESVFANLEKEPTDRVLALLRGTEGSPKVWHAAMVSIAEHLSGKDGLGSEGERLWGGGRDRGAALYLMARQHFSWTRGYPPIDDWSKFAARLGAPVDEASLDSMMKESPLAVGFAAHVWPALGRDFPHVWPVVRHLDAFLDDPRVRARAPTGRGRRSWPTEIRGSAETVLDEIRDRVCEDNDPREDAAWQGYLSQRVAAHPSEGVDYARFVSLTTGCQRARPPRAK